MAHVARSRDVAVSTHWGSLYWEPFYFGSRLGPLILGKYNVGYAGKAEM